MTLWLVSFALADAGSKVCVMRGLPLHVSWTEAGDVRVSENGDTLVSVNVGALKGTTSLQCKGDELKFLTDTHRIPGKITLEKVGIGLGDVLDTLDPMRYELAKARSPRTQPRTKKVRPPEPPARPTGVAAAEACVNIKAWDDYEDGWRVRTISAAEMDAAEGRNLAVALLEGNTYRFYGCAQSSVSDLELYVVDTDGKGLAADTTDDRQPQVDFTPSESGTVHVVLRAPGEDGMVGAALGVVYK